MHFNWNKRVLASSFAIFSMATSLYAIPKGPCDRPSDDVCCESPKPGPFAFSYPVDLGLSCPRDFYVHIDGLAMQAKQDGMDFAIKDTAAGLGIPTAPITLGEVRGFSSDTNSWDYNPGLRLGIGCFLDHDAWAVDFNWTWLNITNYMSTGAGSSLFIPSWGLGSSQLTSATTPATANSTFGARVNAKWEAKYNVLDLGIEKPFHISRYMTMCPHFGIRGGCIDQTFAVKYGGIDTDSQALHHGENDWRGVGLSLGMKTEWIVGKGWNLFANISGSMLASKFEISQRLTDPGTTGPDGFDINNDFYQNVTNLEMAVGLAWSKYFDRNKYRVGLRAAYEFIEWFDQLRFKKFFSGNPGYANDTVSRGDLSLNGFSLRLQLDI